MDELWGEGDRTIIFVATIATLHIGEVKNSVYTSNERMHGDIDWHSLELIFKIYERDLMYPKAYGDDPGQSEQH